MQFIVLCLGAMFVVGAGAVLMSETSGRPGGIGKALLQILIGVITAALLFAAAFTVRIQLQVAENGRINSVIQADIKGLRDYFSLYVTQTDRRLERLEGIHDRTRGQAP